MSLIYPIGSEHVQINDPHMYGIKYIIDIINYISMNTHINIIDYYYEEIKTGKTIYGESPKQSVFPG